MGILQWRTIHHFPRGVGGWGGINVVLNTHTYSSLSTIPNMYIIYQHRRDDRPLELWGKSQTLTYDDWHWALQLVKKIYKWRTWGMFSSVFFFKDNWPGCLPEWNCTKYGLHIGLLWTQDALSLRKLSNEIKKNSCETIQPRHKVYAKTVNFRTPELSSNSSRLGFGETPEQWVFFFFAANNQQDPIEHTSGLQA